MHVGIIGGGQLAQMMITAGVPLGITFAVLALESDESAPAICANTTRVATFDIDSLGHFISSCDVVTFDHELVAPADLEAAGALDAGVFPSSHTLALAANKAVQRNLLYWADISIPRFEIARDYKSLVEAVATIGYPVVAKASHGGYDGRGVFYLVDETDLEDLVAQLPIDFELIIEPKLEIEAEFAVLVVRSRSGEAITYPVLRTVQKDSICHEVTAPAGLEANLESYAITTALQIAELVGAVGVLAIEMFLVDNKLLINELAPRPHNSGHLSIEACKTSQFENHLRAVLDLPLGSTQMTVDFAAMVNLLGSETETDLETNLKDAMQIQDAHVHLYGKTYRRGRKLGHVTATANQADQALDAARRSAAALLNQV